jgi:hypothetical protein
LKLDFTTITRPMVKENTVSLAMTQSPTLKEVGLRPEEERQLERIGIRTVAQLQTLRTSGAGVDGIARLTDGLVPADRLRSALRLGRPMVSHVAPVPLAPAPAPVPATVVEPQPEPAPVVQPVVEPAQPAPVLHIPPGTERLQMMGRNLLGGVAPPSVRLGGRPLETTALEDDRFEVALPPGIRSGALEVDLGDDETVRYDVVVESDGNGWAAPEVAP